MFLSYLKTRTFWFPELKFEIFNFGDFQGYLKNVPLAPEAYFAQHVLNWLMGRLGRATYTYILCSQRLLWILKTYTLARSRSQQPTTLCCSILQAKNKMTVFLNLKFSLDYNSSAGRCNQKLFVNKTLRVFPCQAMIFIHSIHSATRVGHRNSARNFSWQISTFPDKSRWA